MTTEIKRLIRVRTDKGATFKRDGYGKKKQLSDSWRKPRGQHNKQREQKKAKGPLPKPGFGSPVAVRGMHPSGFFEVLLSSVKNLERLDPKTQAVRIAATVGDRKRAGLQEQVIASGFKVLNARTVKTEPEQEKVREPAKDTDKKKKEETKPEKSKIPASSPVKKDTKKAKKTPDAEEKKAAPVKVKKPAKPKTEPESSEETPVKTKAAPSAKPARKSSKPKTDDSAEVKPRAAPKAKAKKKTESRGEEE